MKKVITLVLAIALLLTSVVALADGTPNINSFAKMKVKYVGAKFGNQNWNTGANYYEITLTKPVDRLLIKWAEKGAEPEELQVDDNLQATAIAWGHKYMPGTTQSYNRSVKWSTGLTVNTYEEDFVGYDVKTSERIYAKKAPTTTTEANKIGTKTVGPKRELTDMNTYKKEIASYMALYGLTSADCVIVEPIEVDKDGAKIVVPGYIKGAKTTPISTVSATAGQTAFMTVQGEWAVYYNRAGNIVGIEKFDGQF